MFPFANRVLYPSFAERVLYLMFAIALLLMTKAARAQSGLSQLFFVSKNPVFCNKLLKLLTLKLGDMHATACNAFA